MTPQAQNVTFVGIGAIGLPMALSVAAAGFDVTGVDFSERQRVATPRSCAHTAKMLIGLSPAMDCL